MEENNNILDIVNLENKNSLILADSIVYKTYLENINNMAVVPCPTEIKDLNLNDITRFFKVERFVSEKAENNRDKLTSVFHAVASCGSSVLVLIHSDGEKINYYFGTKTFVKHDIDMLDNSAEALEKTLKGNFPGTKIVSVQRGNEINKLVNDVFSNTKFKNQEKQICTITGIAGLRSKEESYEKLFIQGIEKLVDSMQGEKYSLLLIADPVSQEQVNIVKQGYENLYSRIFPFAGGDLSYGENESDSVSNSLTKGFSKAISESVTKSLSYTKSSSSSHTHSSSKDSYTSTKSESFTKGTAKTMGETKTVSDQEGKTEQKTKGTSKSLQLKFENKSVKNLLEKIDLQLKRLDVCRDTGMWNCSVYCLSNVASVCKIAASVYQSILRGENSSIEAGTVTEWSKENAIAIIPYLEKMHHPVLKLTNADDMEITHSSLISTSELTIHAGIPRTSVSGLPVLETAAFGREVSTHWEGGKNPVSNDGIRLGKIYHMGSEEELHVDLDKNSLASHTFITGSTGSGKSNTVYKLLDEAIKSNCHFLVIEPVKGEYKNVFGGRNDVKVYGTNDKITDLLKINPFSFPDGIHVIEHIERLIEIFNICWPMEAAMPAVLKKAVIAAYEKDAKWNLVESTNDISTLPVFPRFKNVIMNIKEVIKESKWSNEVKGNYEGALVTRLESLTNGIYSRIFVKKEIDPPDLFDKNVIIDLSRIGSSETKSLIMGILMLKLQEHRIASRSNNARAMNEPLKHITILEEAHNLLKRTSVDNSGGSGSVAAKAVEMLSNAIAEMRTYGEGFIIVDQAPGLLDMSVIRNTNTKIIHKLPDKTDRELVGLAAMLNEDQITEIARLQCGVAAIYQNNWIEPVLCKVTEFTESEYKSYIYTGGVK